MKISLCVCYATDSLLEYVEMYITPLHMSLNGWGNDKLVIKLSSLPDLCFLFMLAVRLDADVGESVGPPL